MSQYYHDICRVDTRCPFPGCRSHLLLGSVLVNDDGKQHLWSQQWLEAGLILSQGCLLPSLKLPHKQTSRLGLWKKDLSWALVANK